MNAGGMRREGGTVGLHRGAVGQALLLRSW